MTTTTSTATTLSDRRGWLGVLSVALGSFVIVLSEFLPIGLLPAISADLDVNIGTAGLMVVATGLMAAVSSPVVTVLTSSVDRRIVLLALTVLLVAADVVGALAPNFGVLIVSRVLLGVALGGFWAIGSGIAGRLVREASVIRATSFITAGVSLATVASLPIGSFVSAVASWRLAFVIGAVLGALALVAQLVLLPRIPSIHQVRFATLGALLTIPRARVGLIATAFLFVAQFSAYTYVAPYLEQLVGAPATTVTVALLAFGVAGIAGNFLAGVTLGRSVLGTITVVTVLLAASVVLLPVLASSLPGVLGLLVVWGLVWGGLPLGMQTLMSRAAPSANEGSLALFVTTIQLAIAAGSVVGGVAVTSAGIAFDFYLAGGLAVTGIVVLLALSARRASRPVVPAAVPATTGTTAVQGS